MTTQPILEPAVAFPLPPGIPPGVDSTVWRIDTVNALIREAAYLPIFTVPDRSRPNVPVFSDRGEMIGVEVNEALHRFEIGPDFNAAGLRARNIVGERVASVHIRWMTCPDDFEGGPERVPPPTPIDPSRSQRFVMLEGNMTFHDRYNSGFHAYGAGRTFPMDTPLGPQLGLGSVIDVLEGYGKLKGMEGTNVVNGYINPPNEMVLTFILRMVDPLGRLMSEGPLSPMSRIPHPAPSTAVLGFLGETDPDEKVTLNITPDGRMLGSNVVERLRPVHFSFDTGTSHGIRTRLELGPITGTLRGTLHFNPLDPRPVFPIYTSSGRLEFFSRGGNPVAWIDADIEEGRAFKLALAGAPMPVFRLAGVGRLGRAGGCLTGATGLMSLNAVVSVFPRTLTNFYVLRINDPDGRFHDSLGEVWR
jgi:hypothetical protein